MQSEIKLLDIVHVAAPCDADWDAMAPVDGNRARHCDRCAHSVYNLSALSREAVEALLAETADRPLCIQYSLRPDGSILTAEQPKALQMLRTILARPQARTASVVAALAVMLCIGGTAGADEKHVVKGYGEPAKHVRPVARMGRSSQIWLGKRAIVAPKVNPVGIPKSDAVPPDEHKPKASPMKAHAKTVGATKRK